MHKNGHFQYGETLQRVIMHACLSFLLVFSFVLSAQLVADDDDIKEKLEKREEEIRQRRSGGPKQNKQVNPNRRKNDDEPQRVQKPSKEQRRKDIEQKRRGSDQSFDDQRIKAIEQQRGTPRPTVNPRGERQAGDRREVLNREAIRREAREFSDRLNREAGRDSEQAEQFRSSYRERIRDNSRTAKRISGEIRRDYPGYRRWFNRDFYRDRHYYPPYWQRNVNWWRGAQWPRLHRWLRWTPSIYPIYYYRGYPLPGNVEIDSYYPDPYPTAEEPDSGDWLPLGVYVVGPDAPQSTAGNIFIQLAIDRDGDLAGTYYHSSTDESYNLEGFVDPKTQLAYWKQTNDLSAPLMSTGIYNLTQDVVDVQLTFPSGTVQSISLIKLEDK